MSEMIERNVLGYTVVIGQAYDRHGRPTNFAGHVPALPICVATGATPEDVEERMRTVIEWHLEALRESGRPIPEPQTVTTAGEADR